MTLEEKIELLLRRAFQQDGAGDFTIRKAKNDIMALLQMHTLPGTDLVPVGKPAPRPELTVVDGDKHA